MSAISASTPSHTNQHSALLVPDMPRSKKATTQVRWASCNEQYHAAFEFQNGSQFGGWNTANSDTLDSANVQTTIKNLEILPFNWACCSNRTQGSSFNITLGKGDMCFFAWPRLVLAPLHDFGTTSQELQTKETQTYKPNNGRRKLKQLDKN